MATQVDDFVWATSTKGRLFVVDGKANTTYVVRTDFVVGTVFAVTPDDSRVPGVLGTLDLKTGFFAPQIIGMKKPTGFLFIPDEE